MIAADDAINTSEHEIGFAQASYGDEAVKPFQAALDSAKAHLSESFKLQQQLDDEIPDTIEEQRQWLGEIIKRSEEANAALNAEKAAFDELRELERTAPTVLANLRAQAAEARTRRCLGRAKTGRHDCPVCRCGRGPCARQRGASQGTP